MSPANGLMRIAILLFAVSNFLTLVKGMQRPWFGSHHYSNRPGPPTDGYGFSTNWDDKMSPNGYSLYCKRLHKKISIDEQIFPFAPCVFEDDNTDNDDDSNNGYSQDYLTQSNSNMNIDNERNHPIASSNAPTNQGNWRQNSKSKGPLISSFNSPQNSGVLGLKKEVLGNNNFGSTNSAGKTDSAYEYLQRPGFQLPGDLSQTKNGFTNFVDSDDQLSRDKFGFSRDELFKDPSKFLMEAHQNSGVLGLKKEVLGNSNFGSTNSAEKTDSAYEYLQRSGFQIPGDLSQTKNGFTNFVDSDDQLSRDKFGFSRDELFKDPSKILMEAQSFEKYKSGKEASDELEKLEASNENINNQLDRDRILSVLRSKSKYDFDNYRNLENFHYPSLFASSNAGNDDKKLKFPIKPPSTNNSNEKNSSTSVNETTPKSILKKKNYQETKYSPPQFYRYSPSHQNVSNIRLSRMGPSSYHGLQSGSFSINGFGPFNSVQDESSLQELKSIFGVNDTSDK